MQHTQLALFGDVAALGTGRPYPWPPAQPEPETTEPAVNPDQLSFNGDNPEAEAA
ncbi:hypothetical protein AB0N99_30490 [Streptomyces sp. NPDC093272]|uniref:hypothetical protein n=1 Tax=Streptomyces sp. NPDC093272 TaxID=3154981 RepID=UPI003443C44F